jgi:UDP-N-acetylmuramoyl-L-alanyl-D-glutamate--2,6-diaminopimelate ligase
MIAVANHRQKLDRILAADSGITRSEISGCMTLDSRKVGQGDIFVALPGAQHDGRDYVQQALAQGASLVLAEADGLSAFIDPNADKRIVSMPNLSDLLPDLAKDFYGDPSQTMALVAVTGTNGKTSVVEFVGQLLRSLGFAAGCMGTLGSRLEASPAEATNTTPDVLTINDQLVDWQRRGVKHVALEASSHALHQGRLRSLSIHTGVFTNLTRDHLDYHDNEADYAAAKLSLITVELSGRFNAFNVVAAIAAVTGLGFDFQQVCAVASDLKPVPGRMERILISDDRLAVVDYAHTPDALESALQTLRGETKGRLWVVFGCGGDRDSGKRSLMGRAAARWADHIVVTSDNPRSEAPAKIIEDVISGCGADAEIVVDRAEAIRHALSLAEAGDTVLVAGKGHEDYQDVAGVRLPFSDQQILSGYQSVDGVRS